MVVVLIVDTKYTFTQMAIGLGVSVILGWVGNVYDNKFAEIREYPRSR